MADGQEGSQDAGSSKIHTNATPQTSCSAPSLGTQVVDAPSDFEEQALVHDILVDVLIRPRLLAPGHDSSPRSTKQSEPYRQASAKMTISIWSLEKQSYFTLTFQNINYSWKTLPAMRTRSRLVSGPKLPMTDPYTFSRVYSPRTNSSSSMPPKSFSRDSSRADPAVQDKISRMKDAIIDTIGIPIMAMWKDGSLAVHNKAISRLMHEDPDIASTDVDHTLSRFRAYTEDFERELEQYEWPLIKLCREQKSIKAFRVGTIDSRGTRRVFEISGDGIHDEQTGEFLAGICTLTDVTWYVDVVKAQSEQDEKKFQLICECMPQTVSTLAYHNIAGTKHHALGLDEHA